MGRMRWALLGSIAFMVAVLVLRLSLIGRAIFLGVMLGLFASEIVTLLVLAARAVMRRFHEL